MYVKQSTHYLWFTCGIPSFMLQWQVLKISCSYNDSPHLHLKPLFFRYSLYFGQNISLLFHKFCQQLLSKCLEQGVLCPHKTLCLEALIFWNVQPSSKNCVIEDGYLWLWLDYGRIHSSQSIKTTMVSCLKWAWMKQYDSQKSLITGQWSTMLQMNITMQHFSLETGRHNKMMSKENYLPNIYPILKGGFNFLFHPYQRHINPNQF